MDIKDVLLLVLPVMSAIFGSYLTFLFASKAKKDETIRKFKEEKYANLIILLQAFVGNTVSSRGKKDFFEENYRSWLYCSDEVTRAINGMLSMVVNKKGEIPNPIDGQRAVGKIILEMRKDLLGKTRLKELDFQYIDVV